ncbi:hypothetical protein [Escherichia coli]|uniref:hypothetical protein n=1 Tax=Escherichia coli TaxID=562 RepID=UPI0004D61C4D|nr:hypothetical protein [Escherichia coli]KDX38643.1 EAL domain protein [Escherichia coli 2-177-06_S3_C2]KEO03719.1 EAL domain protein [Escherichia coli 2-177-06_S3_C3]
MLQTALALRLQISGHIVENVIELARRLGIDIIAEGIETESQELFMTGNRLI